MSDSIDRRSFLKTAGIAAAVVSAIQSPHVLADEKGGKMKKAVGMGMVGEKALPLGDRMKMLRELGFDGVELVSPGIKDREALKKAIDDAKLEVSEILSGSDWATPITSAKEETRATCLKNLKLAMEDAKFFGTTSVLFVPGVCNKQIPYDEAYKRAHEGIKQMIPVAQELGVKIAVENVWNDFLLSPLEMARFIDEFESPWIGAHFDCGNVAAIGYPEQWIRILGKRILKLHIKEFNKKVAADTGKGKGFNWKLGDEGGIDWPSIVKALNDIGYSGWATAEFGGGDRAVLTDVAARMDKVLQLK